MCDFWFTQNNGESYFEMHHIFSDIGNHPKNLLLVCPNCHKQFTYALQKQYFSEDKWLTKVIFTNRQYNVKQIFIEKAPKLASKELHLL